MAKYNQIGTWKVGLDGEYYLQTEQKRKANGQFTFKGRKFEKVAYAIAEFVVGVAFFGTMILAIVVILGK